MSPDEFSTVELSSGLAKFLSGQLARSYPTGRSGRRSLAGGLAGIVVD
jgi:hypothetical protein